MIYLLPHADEYLSSLRIAALKEALGDPEMVDLNTLELNGTQLEGTNLLAHAGMMPFLTARRLIVVRGYLNHLESRMSASKTTDAAAYVEAATVMDGLTIIADNADVVFLEEKGIDRRRHLWKGFEVAETAATPKRRIAGLEARIKDRQIILEEQVTPDIKALPGWIQRHAAAQEIRIDGRAVQLLATFVGPDLRRLDNELEKLATYANGNAIAAADVKLLVSDTSEALIWSLTDALSQRNGHNAMRSLYELRRSDASPFYLLTMVARQFRIMLKVKEAVAQGQTNEYDIARTIKESPYPVKKAMQQSQRYSFDQLGGILRRLLEADFAMKTGADQETTIDILVAELTHPVT